MSSPAFLLFAVVLLNFSVFTEQLQYSPDVPLSLSSSGAKTAASGIESCKKAVPKYFNATIYSIRTSDGSEFIRHFVNAEDKQCFEKSVKMIISNSTDFKTCAEKTVKAAYNSFTFDQGLCTAYTTWRPKEISTCFPGSSGNGTPVYVVKTQLGPFQAPQPTLSTLTAQGNKSGIASFTLEMMAYDPCHQESAIAAYVIKLNGTKVGRVPYLNNKTQRFLYANSTLCNLYNQTFEITAVDASGNNVTNTVDTVRHFAPGDPALVPMNSGDCLAISGNLSPGRNDSESKQLCLDLDSNTTLFTVYSDGELTEYIALMAARRDNSSDADEDHFVYLMKEGSVWKWQESGLVQPTNNSAVWEQDAGIDDCVASLEEKSFRLKWYPCFFPFSKVVCRKKFSP